MIRDWVDNFTGANRQIWDYPPKNGNDNYYDEDEDKETVDLDDDEEDEDLPLKTIDCELENIDDLIDLGKKYDSTEKVRYNFDMKRLAGLVGPLEKLKAMIGMKTIKEMVFNHILFQ